MCQEPNENGKRKERPRSYLFSRTREGKEKKKCRSTVFQLHLFGPKEESKVEGEGKSIYISKKGEEGEEVADC